MKLFKECRPEDQVWKNLSEVKFVLILSSSFIPPQKCIWRMVDGIPSEEITSGEVKKIYSAFAIGRQLLIKAASTSPDVEKGNDPEIRQRATDVSIALMCIFACA